MHEEEATKKKVFINFHDLTRPILEVSLTDVTMWKQPFSNKLLQLFDNVLPLGETRVVLRHEGDNFIHKTDHLGAAEELGKIVLAGKIGKNVESCTDDFRVEHLGRPTSRWPEEVHEPDVVMSRTFMTPRVRMGMFAPRRCLV